MELEKLRYRWAAMNPAANGDHDDEERYLGAEPLDPALADRFGFPIEVPDWGDLSEAERKEILLDQFRGRHEFPVQVPALVDRSTVVFRELCARPPAQLCGYFLALESQLRGAGTRFSSRRMTTLLRISLGIHASASRWRSNPERNLQGRSGRNRSSLPWPTAIRDSRQVQWIAARCLPCSGRLGMSLG
jgi:hypothetical protein